jgi:hypothetical protein
MGLDYLSTNLHIYGIKCLPIHVVDPEQKLGSYSSPLKPDSIYKGGLACLPASIYMCITTPWDSSTWKPMRSPMKQSDEIGHFLQEGICSDDII